ncbi:hypothetical protein [Roseburia sp. 499]|uniref:hypothetical protein n=1 Tax=Roseburia sp. 499 TaxID=1261634 RepID=UPI000950C44E|nr:hypothetical protein [Roseburia sp. 499]WVK68627.1 hypothetical protein BIV20_09515 [Roseburia sp. 499]
MIERKDILSIPYLKKTTFTGSYEGMRFRFALIKTEEEEHLEVCAWDAPYAYDSTPEEKKQRTNVEFSEEGICQGVEWLNEVWQKEPDRWKKAKTNW